MTPYACPHDGAQVTHRHVVLTATDAYITRCPTCGTYTEHPRR